VLKPRYPDKVLIERVGRFLITAGCTLPSPTTAEWVATAMAHADGGHILDAPRIGPALRAYGFRHSFRRRGDRRQRVWYPPGTEQRQGRGADEASRMTLPSADS
jgi:hypothetical protein